MKFYLHIVCLLLFFQFSIVPAQEQSTPSNSSEAIEGVIEDAVEVTDVAGEVTEEVVSDVFFGPESIELDEVEETDTQQVDNGALDTNTLDTEETAALLEQSLNELQLTDLRPVDFYGNSLELRRPNPPNYLLINSPELNLNAVSTGELGPGDGQNFRDASYLDIWQFSADEGEAIEILVRSEFDSFLSIYTPDGNLYAVNDDGFLNQQDSPQLAESISKDAAIRLRLTQSGRYMVVLSGTGQNASGLYSIYTTKLPVQEGGALKLSQDSLQNIYASFGEGDQKDSELALRFDEFSFDLNNTQTISFDIFVDDYDGRLLLFDSQDKLIADSSIQGNPIIEQLKADSYRLRAAIVDDGSVDKKEKQDAFNLYKIEVERLQLSYQTEVAIGDDFLSLLTTKDRRVNGRYIDSYRFVVSETTEAIIDLRSKAFDAYLYLYNNAGHIVAENDDASEETGTDAQLVLELPAGTYEIVVTSYVDADKKSGLYNLAITNPAENSDSNQKEESGTTATIIPNTTNE